MTKEHGLRALIGVTVICVAFGTFALAQSPAARQGPASLDDLLVEIKGLRADLAQSSSATIKTQLLLARLQVEEQRMNGIAKQMVDVQTQLSTARQSVAATESSFKKLDDIVSGRSPSSIPAEVQKEFMAQLSGQLGDLKSTLEIQQRREQELTNQGAVLANQFAAEQSRWSEFNDRLDALERSLSPK
jgi:hypothetical protein